MARGKSYSLYERYFLDPLTIEEIKEIFSDVTIEEIKRFTYDESGTDEIISTRSKVFQN